MKILQNKGQTAGYALIMLVVTVGLFCFFLFDMRDMPHKPTILLDLAPVYWGFKLLCLICSVVCAAATVYCIKQLFSKEPLIEICDAYFYDRSSAISVGKIAWEDMKNVYVRSGFLNIELKNPDTYFEKMNRIQRMLIKGNAKLGYGVICISTQRFEKQRKEFLEEFSKRKPIG